jgi:hypothetical protein
MARDKNKCGHKSGRTVRYMARDKNKCGHKSGRTVRYRTRDKNKCGHKTNIPKINEDFLCYYSI